MNETKNSKLPFIAAVITAVIFGFSFIFTKNALDNLDLFQLLGFRFAAAALSLTLLKVAGMIKVNIGIQNLKQLLIIAFLQPVLYFIFETIGVNFTSASESGIIIALVPISITIFAVFMLKEHLVPFQWISIVVSVTGVLLIALTGVGVSVRGQLVGVAALICAVIAAGLYNVLSRKISGIYSPIEVTFVMMWVGAVVFNVIGLTLAVSKGGLHEYFNSLSNTTVLLDIFYLGILSSVIAFFLLNYSLSKIEASKSAVFMNLTPLVTVFAGIVFRGERLLLLQSIGSMLVLAGIWGTTRKYG